MGMYLGGQKISPIIKVGEIKNQDKTITENGTYTADVGYTGLGEVTVNVSGGGDSGGAYLVQVLDYDGSVIKQDHLNTGDTFTLPDTPIRSGLVFQEWSSPVAITNNTVTVTNSDIIIGAVYTTASGLSEFDITLTTITGLSVTLNMDGTKDWGDGTSDTSTTHTYTSAGDYIITCDGSTMTTSDSSGLFGQTSSNINYYAKDVRLGSNVTSISSYAFQYCYSLKSITIPSSVTTIRAYAFSYGYSLKRITIPSSVTTIASSAFRNNYSLTSIIIPNSVTSIGSNVFRDCNYLSNITIPESVKRIGSYAFAGCYFLTSITIPGSVESINSYVFQNCYSILEYDFSNHTAVPTLFDTSAFEGINQICKIKVPASLETQWKEETNWINYSSYIIGV